MFVLRVNLGKSSSYSFAILLVQLPSEEFCIGRKHWYLCVKKHCLKNCPDEKQQSNDETRRVIHLFRGILHDGENMDI